ncbi:MAG: hypothetical protein APF80_02130 [Alphaproteobacteria bacterium BRH_c36]|nr:MAG: hypothetical protein APF80_02130 [Alphaproteobacteria bacterium BRH_c36]
MCRNDRLPQPRTNSKAIPSLDQFAGNLDIERLTRDDGVVGALGSSRVKLWEIRVCTHCSLIGTCLSDRDLATVLKSCGLKIENGARPYQIHSYVVKAVCEEGPIARAVQKLLDRRHAGMLRIVARIKNSADLEQLWEREYAAGRIAGIYWAIHTCAHVPEELFSRVFGEVHMLSHVLGRTTHAEAERASELASQIADLEAKIARQREHQQRAIGERDRTIESLQSERINRAAGLASDNSKVGGPRRFSSKRDTTLVTSRERARLAESRVIELERENKAIRSRLRRFAMQEVADLSSPECPGAAACRLQIPPGEKLHVLYLGGRTGTVDRLRKIATEARAEFLHHDGGLQESLQRIRDLVARSHVVFCPVDCVSHRACLAAKDHCRKLQRAFVPLRSAGGTTFEKALQRIEIGA